MPRDNGLTRLEALWAPGCALLGVEYAIMGGAMTWASERNLVAAISNAGGFGVLACGAMTPDLLSGEIEATKARTGKPFGVNLISMHPDLDALIDICADYGIGHVVLAGGLPTVASLGRIKATGARVLAFAPTLAFARRLARSGVDGVIVEGMEAGGHIGPVSTSILSQEILPCLDGTPVFVAGGIGRGQAIAGYLRMGAAGVQLGTRFVCATESVAHPNFKASLIRASARDAQPSVQLDPRFPVIPVRAITNKASRDFLDKQFDVIRRHDSGELGVKAAQLEIEHFWSGALRRAVVDGDIEHGSLMAGQSVGMVTAEQPTAEIIDTLVHEAVSSLAQHS
ncbi:MAG: nitronate monooxygenase [Alphaproteobacteria bacterium]|nr:nitronate monooxygenase [Alphaproteobacteria bacterium]